MKSLLFIFALMWMGTGFPGCETIFFTKTYGGDENDYAKCIQQTIDDGYIIAGYTQSFGAGNYDVYLVKTDSRGKELWSKTYGGKENDFGNFVIQTDDGGYLIAGSTKSLVPEGFPGGPVYAYVIKTDPQGKELWSKSYGQGTTDIGECIIQKTDNRYVIVGGTGSYSMSIDAMVLEIDENGNIPEEKKKNKTSVAIFTPGGDGFDTAYSIQKTSDGNYIIAGETDSSGKGNSDVYLVKLKISHPDIGFSTIWEKTFGTKDIDYGRSVHQTPDGGYIIAGNTGKVVDNTDLFDIYLIKTDSKGYEKWSRTFGGEKNDIGYDLQNTSDGGFIIAGRTYNYGAGKSDMYVIKTNAFGYETWSKTFGSAGYDGAYSIRQTSDNGYIIAGYTGSAETGKTDMYVVKIDSPGKDEGISRDYSYQDFLDAAKTGNIERLMHYASEPVTFVPLFKGKANTEPEVMKKEEIKKLFTDLLEKDPRFWKYNEKPDEKNITYVIDSWITYFFYFEQKADRLQLQKIIKDVPGL